MALWAESPPLQQGGSHVDLTPCEPPPSDHGANRMNNEEEGREPTLAQKTVFVCDALELIGMRLNDLRC